VDRASGAGRIRLRADFAGRLRGGGRGGSAATNYQILPGDRVLIAEDDVTTFNNWLTKLTTPVERLLGVGVAGQFGHPQLPDPRPVVQPDSKPVAEVCVFRRRNENLRT